MISRALNGIGEIKLSSLFKLFAVLYIAHKLLPAAGHYMPSIVYAGIFAVLFVCIFYYSALILKRNDISLIFMIFATSLLSLIPYFLSGNIASSVIYVYGELQIVLFAFIALWYIGYADLKAAKRFLFILILFYVITAATTYIGCVRFPQAARYLAANDSGTAEFQLYASNNIGSFSFVYELVLLFPLLIYMFKNGKMNKLAAVLIFILLGITIIKTEYTGALIFFVSSVPLVFIKNFSVKKIFIIIIIILAILIIGNLFLANVFDSLSTKIESEEISDRFEFIADLLRGETGLESSASGTSRIERYKKSWEAFSGNLLGGTWSVAKVGGHSFILDTLGQFGILGLLSLIFVYGGIYKFGLYPNKNQDFYPYIVWVYILAIIMAVINPKSYLFIFICVIPLFSHVMKVQNTEREEKV